MRTDIQWQGSLQHHDQPCDECGGTGLDNDEVENFKEECAADNVPSCGFCADGETCDVCEPPCTYCNKEGTLRWGSWYTADKTECHICGVEKDCGNMFEGGDVEYVCYPCYVQLHQRDCGCDSWAASEAELELPPIDRTSNMNKTDIRIVLTEENLTALLSGDTAILTDCATGQPIKIILEDIGWDRIYQALLTAKNPAKAV